MKRIIFLLTFSMLMYSCGEKAANTKVDADAQQHKNLEKSKTTDATDELQKSLELVGGFLNEENDDTSNKNSLPEADALEKILKMSDTSANPAGGLDSFGAMLKSKAILDLLEASGVSRQEMEQLINNPDSLRTLAQEAIKNRKEEQQQKAGYHNQGKLSNEQLTSKNTPTGVSLAEAILLVQAESGPEATMAKLKKIDSLAGTNVMEKLEVTEAGYIMRDIAQKNEAPPSIVEKEKMEHLRKLSGQLHSNKEANQLLTELQETEQAIASGTLKASPQYQKTIQYRKKIVQVFQKDFARKATMAKAKFKKRNPDLYFGDVAGQTYVGHMKKAVYLPLGKLSFADKVVKAQHPKLMTQQVNNVLGEPDVLQGFLAEDITGIYSLGLGGSLTVQFVDNALTDVNGPDLYIFEIGQIEPTNLEISKDGKTWIKVGKIDGGVAEVDIAPFVKKGTLYYYVRLKDLKQQSALPGADVDAIAAIGAAMRLNLDSKVLFETGKSVLKPEGIAALKKLATSITVLKKGNIIVEGHTDDVGSTSTNQKLSLARAKSVSAELKKIIPNGFRWKEVGRGETTPLVANDSDENRAKNRRVEVLVVPN